MCAVSYVHDYAQRISLEDWTLKKYNEWSKWKQAAEEFDRQTNQPNCVDPKKAAFEEEILKRLEAIEKKLAPSASAVYVKPLYNPG